jgi:two-component system sensor histidine kinase MprB
MLRGLTARVALSFLAVALVAWVVIGAALFVILRQAHTDATGSRLEDLATSLVGQARTALAAGDNSSALGVLQDQLTSDVEAFLVLADGRIVGLQGGPAPGPGTFVVDPGGRGVTNHSTAVLTDGRLYDYASIRIGAAPGGRALVLATQDRSGGEALRDLVGVVPAVVLITLLVGGPVAWLVARSVGGPLRRLAAATANVPSTPVEPLPLEGPTEVRRLIERFNAMTAELAATRHRESELLANLRHDLRTPLTVIGGFAAALADGTATGDEATRASQAIEEEATRLEALVDELGAIERLRSGNAGLRPEPIEAGSALARAAERFRPGARAAGQEIVVEESTDATDALGFAADRTAIDRILGNLIANALASSPRPDGHVWLAARSIPASVTGDPGTIALSVTDDGPGFPPGTIDRVFDRFYRADPARSGPGSGLGLAIVRELAEAHGGTALAEQVAPHGARVSVLLPRIPRIPSPPLTGAAES